MLYFSPWKTVLIWLAVVVGILFAIPNLFAPTTLQSFPGFLPQSRLALGLDLQGGVHLQLKLDRQELVENRLETVRDDVRRLLRADSIGYTGLSGRGQTVTVRNRDEAGAEAAMREHMLAAHRSRLRQFRERPIQNEEE